MATTIKLTDRKALSPHQNVWVEASAGSGKTYLLTQRYLSLLLHGVPAEKILCLTYTKAAAHEMKERILKRLYLWRDKPENLQEDLMQMGIVQDDRLNSHIQFLFQSLTASDLSIQTIHAFCQSLLRRFPFEAGVSPFFEPMSDDQIAVLNSKIISQELVKTIQSEPDFLQKAFPKMALNYMKDTIRDALKNAQLWQVDPAVYLQKNWQDLLNDQQGIISGKSADILLLIKAFQDGGVNQKKAADDLAQYSKVGQIELLSKALLTKEFEIRKLINDKIRKAFPTAEITYQKLCEDLMTYLDLESMVDSSMQSFYLAKLVQNIRQAFSQEKEKSNWLDYDDLLIKAYELLHDSQDQDWVRYKLDGGIDHLLLDEAQDTNPQQWQLIQKICSEFFAGEGQVEQPRSLFVVGDPKQSIYGFQGANLDHFYEARTLFKTMAQGGDYGWHEEALTQSFRSLPLVLKKIDQWINGSELKNGILFDQPQIQHWPTRPVSGSQIEFWLFEEKFNHIQKAEELFKKIEDLLASKIFVPVRGRAIQPQDIMILYQTRNKGYYHLKQLLAKSKIPVQEADKVILSDSLIYRDFLSLIKFVYQPHDDLNLAHLLKTPFFQISDEYLFVLTQIEGENLWQKINTNDQGIAQELLGWKSQARQTPLDQFIRYVLDEKAYAVFTKIYGPQAVDILKELPQIIAEKQKIYSNPIELIYHLDEAVIELAYDQPAGEGISLLTIHRSKGLQAPILILADADVPPKLKDDRTGYWLDVDGLPYYFSGKETAPYFLNEQIDQIENKRTQEYNRLLYVALTRAEDHLVICGSALPNAKSWLSNMDTSEVLFKEESSQIVGKASHSEKRESQLSPISARSFELSQPSKSSMAIAKIQSSVAQKIGTQIHALFENLPQDLRAQKDYIKQYLSIKDLQEFGPAIINILKNPQALRLLSGADVYKEVPIMARNTQGAIQVGRVDLLKISDSLIEVVDFKTDLNPPDSPINISVEYRQQMQRYKNILEKAYPHSQIKLWLLYVRNEQLFAID